MTRIIHTPKAMLVEVPDGLDRFAISDTYGNGKLYLNGENSKTFEMAFHLVSIPPGSYGQPILAGEMDGKMAEDIVEQDYFDGVGYQFANYDIERKWSFGMRFNNAAASFYSLLRSHNLKPETTVVILKTM